MVGSDMSSGSLHTHLDVLHVFKEVRLGVAVVGELYQVSEVFLGRKRLDQAGQDVGILVLDILEEQTGTFIMLSGAAGGSVAGGGLDMTTCVPTSVLLRSPLMTASRMVCWMTFL